MKLTSPDQHSAAANERFVTTRWTQVLAASENSNEGRQALSDLCAVYYGPVVAFLRRHYHAEDEARDLAHEFFASVLATQSLSRADPNRGRFRSYILGALKHFLANRRARSLAEKRGGSAPHLLLDNTEDSGPEPALPQVATENPDKAYDREWALRVLESALEKLKSECSEAGRQSEFARLKPWLTGENVRGAKEAAAELGFSDATFRVTTYRLRRRFRQIVRSEVARTVNDPSDVSAEMQVLIEALA